MVDPEFDVVVTPVVLNETDFGTSAFVRVEPPFTPLGGFGEAVIHVGQSITMDQEALGENEPVFDDVDGTRVHAVHTLGEHTLLMMTAQPDIQPVDVDHFAKAVGMLLERSGKKVKVVPYSEVVNSSDGR